ncbi:helix-turn-helix domain-containing protein [Paenibacillus dendritiformis]|uniref:helix-turn-helix domain-containing protein n=1 Tax=Paenibacillus dendritiformis TaxID=130049 RepID=UPI003CCF89E4
MKNSPYNYYSECRIIGSKLKPMIKGKYILKKLSKEINVSTSVLSGFLNDKRTMQRSKIFRLCKLLNVDYNDIF